MFDVVAAYVSTHRSGVPHSENLSFAKMLIDLFETTEPERQLHSLKDPTPMLKYNVESSTITRYVHDQQALKHLKNPRHRRHWTMFAEFGLPQP